MQDLISDLEYLIEEDDSDSNIQGDKDGEDEALKFSCFILSFIFQ